MGLDFDVPLYAIFLCCIEPSYIGRKALCGKASSVPSDAELGSRRRSYAAKLLPITKLRSKSLRSDNSRII